MKLARIAGAVALSRPTIYRLIGEAELIALFELLGLNEGLIRNENTHDEAVKQLRSKANELTERVVTVAQHVQTGLLP